MACAEFPTSGLVPNVTTHVVDNVTYRWDGTVWEAITSPFDSSQISHDSNGTVKDTLDRNSEYLALKIFQAPTDGGLTEIQTRTVNADEVYEVRKTSDDSLATIYSDAAGTTEIVQNGTANVSGSDGVVEFYIADGEYRITIDAISNNFIVGNAASNVESERGGSVQDFIDSTSDALSILNKSPSINMDVTSLPVGRIKNVVGANQDRCIMLFGDSHGWGHGAPEWDNFTSFDNFSSHSAPVYNKGFMARVEGWINNKLGFNTGRYGGGTSQLSNFVTDAHVLHTYNGDPDNTKPIRIRGGNVTISEEPYLGGLRAQPEWYTPECHGDVYSAEQYREKLTRGIFDTGVTRLEKCTVNTFNPEGKSRFWDMRPDTSVVPYGGSFQDLIWDNGALAVDTSKAPIVLGTKDPTTQRVYVPIPKPKLSWVAEGNEFFIAGFGYGKFGAEITINGNQSIQLADANVNPAGAALARVIAPNTKVYPKSSAVGLMTLDMQSPARVLYISVISQAGGGKLRFDFTPNRTSGYDPLVNTDQGAVKDNKANEYAWHFLSGNNAILLVNSNGALTATPYVSVDATGFTLDTDNTADGGAREEYLFRVDLGGRMQGRINMYLADVTSDFVEFRGIITDNNKVANFSMGGHTVGGWLGEEESYNDPIRDHIGDILKYTPVQPSHVITQVPFVNEYLRQTPIATFKARLQEFVDRFTNHLVPGATTNYNLVGVDFMFFTSLRNKEIAFEGGVSDPVTYDMYVQAVKEFCQDNNHAFVDCEAKLFELVNQGLVSYERLFNNSNHPSDYANEIIFEELKGRYLYTMI